MSANSTIEWTESSWNPVTGCTKVSQGCKHCYAETFYERFHGKGSFKNVICHPNRLTIPLHWRKPRLIFVNSMSDLFHESVPFDFIDKVFAVMALCPEHTFQVLTKRAERMHRYFNSNGVRARIFWAINKLDSTKFLALGGYMWPLPNVWIGVSVEDQKAADERIPYLLQVPAAVRWLSCEPLLGPVDIRKWLKVEYCNGKALHWVVVGGESGNKARPMHPDWAISLRNQCHHQNIPFFFKQWGAYQNGSYSVDHKFKGKHLVVLNNGQTANWKSDSELAAIKKKYSPDEWMRHNPWVMAKVGKKKAGRLLDYVTHDGMPAVKQKEVTNA